MQRDEEKLVLDVLRERRGEFVRPLDIADQMYEPKTKLNLFFRQKISRLLNWYEHSGVVSKRVYHCEECGGAHGAEFRLEREPGVEQE